MGIPNKENIIALIEQSEQCEELSHEDRCLFSEIASVFDTYQTLMESNPGYAPVSATAIKLRSLELKCDAILNRVKQKSEEKVVAMPVASPTIESIDETVNKTGRFPIADALQVSDHELVVQDDTGKEYMLVPKGQPVPPSPVCTQQEMGSILSKIRSNETYSLLPSAMHITDAQLSIIVQVVLCEAAALRNGEKS